MTTETKEKILVNIDLEIFVTKKNVFVRVVDPKDPTSDNWPEVQKFYRWCAAELNLMPSEVWNPRLSYAVLSIKDLKSLRRDFSVKVLSKKRFYEGI